MLITDDERAKWVERLGNALGQPAQRGYIKLLVEILMEKGVLQAEDKARLDAWLEADRESVSKK